MKRLDEMKWSETRDETPRRFGWRPRRDPTCTGPRPRQDIGTSRDRDVETETTSLLFILNAEKFFQSKLFTEPICAVLRRQEH